jgi:hypothetical protein
MLRPESRQAYDRWRTGLTGEHRAAGPSAERLAERARSAGVPVAEFATFAHAVRMH